MSTVTAHRATTKRTDVTFSRRLLEWGGVLAGLVLIAVGVGALVMSINGRTEVRDLLAAQKITATPDAAEITNGRLQPGQLVDTGEEARQFALIMEHHTLVATEGKRYAEMGRFLTPTGQDTSDEALAAKTADGRPVENGLRNMWVTETALATALNTSYMAEQLSLFGIVVGVALLLAGIGFVVLALGGALRRHGGQKAAV
jgi:hypothetical protein